MPFRFGCTVLAWLLLIPLFGSVTVFAETLADIKIAAEAGDPVAQYQLGDSFMTHGDSVTAELWYRKSAAQGYVPAEAKLGNLLWMHVRMTFSLKPEEKQAIGHEAFKWAMLAAEQGNARGEADVADMYMDGKFVQRDLLEAYKWGDLASHGSMIDSARISGASIRDSAVLKMSTDQINEARRRVAAFVPHKPDKDELPDPSWTQKIKLSGISGTADRRMAIINGRTFAKGDTANLKIDGHPVRVSCQEIHESSVILTVDGVEKPQEIFLKQH